MPEPTHITGGESVLQAVGQQDRARSPASLSASNYDAISTAIYVTEWSVRTSLKAAPSWPLGPEPEREAALSARLLLLDSKVSDTTPLSVYTLTSWPFGPNVNENLLILSLAHGFRIGNVHTALIRADSSASTLSDSKRAKCCPIGGSFAVCDSYGSVIITRTGNAGSFNVVGIVTVRPSTYDPVVPHLSLSRKVRGAAVSSSICVTPGYERCALDEVQTRVETTFYNATSRVPSLERTTIRTWTPRNAGRARSLSESSGDQYSMDYHNVVLYVTMESTMQFVTVHNRNLDFNAESQSRVEPSTISIWDITGSKVGSIVPGICSVNNMARGLSTDH